MAVSRYIKNENAVYLALGFNVNQATPLDARLVVTKYEGLTQASEGDNIFYDGIVVSVVDDTDQTKNGLYQLIHMPASDIKNWHKIATAAEVKNIKNALSSVKINGVSGTQGENGINFTISGDSIHLGANYDGEGNAEAPSTGDTINDAIKKIVDIIIKNEKVVAASANDLNDKIGKLSGDAITNISLDDSKSNLVITKDGSDIKIPLTDLAKVYTFDTNGDDNHNVKFTTRENGGQVVIQGNVSLDSGEYTVTGNKYV